MSIFTAADLLDRLRAVHGKGDHISDEKLAAKLPISGSTLARWKRSDPEHFQAIIEMLDQAGWLNTDADVPDSVGSDRDHLATLAATVVEIGETQKEILRRLPSPVAAPRSTARAAPKRRTK